jgi:hypothetical protein
MLLLKLHWQQLIIQRVLVTKDQTFQRYRELQGS